MNQDVMPDVKHRLYQYQSGPEMGSVELAALHSVSGLLSCQVLKQLGLSAGQVGDVHIDETDENMCKACGDKRLTFEPPSLYCTCCGQRIKRNQVRCMALQPYMQFMVELCMFGMHDPAWPIKYALIECMSAALCTTSAAASCWL